MVLAKTQIRSRIESRQRAAREEDRAAQRIHRALFGRHAFEPGDVAQEGSRAAADQRTGALQHPAPVHPLRDEAPLRAASRSKFAGCRSLTATQTVIHELHRQRRARREDRADGTQRRRQDDAATLADRGRAGRRRRTVRDRRRLGRVGSRSLGRLFRAGSHGSRSGPA